jgi:hypothetical protein
VQFKSHSVLLPHPDPLPEGEGVKGASLTVSTLILAPMLSEGDRARVAATLPRLLHPPS